MKTIRVSGNWKPKYPELLSPDQTPFNLSGEQIDNSTTSEGEARVRALAESEARKAQHLLDLETLTHVPFDLPMNDHERRDFT